MTTGKTTRPAVASAAFRAADYLDAGDIPAFLADVVRDGDARALPLALLIVEGVIEQCLSPPALPNPLYRRVKGGA